MKELKPVVNIPLLRKAVEWAEAEAAKPEALCEWNQGAWVALPEEMSFKSPDCGTCYCVAGHIVASLGYTHPVKDEFSDRMINPVTKGHVDPFERAQKELGITRDQAHSLFSGGNDIEQVRQIAEAIAGERL
jgi:hypothetical protein